MKLKQNVGLFLAIIFIFSCNINVYADYAYHSASTELLSVSDQETIIAALQDIAPAADNFGLADIDFQKIRVSNCIPVYEILNGNLELLNFRIYALYESSILTAAAVVTDLQNNQYMAQIYTCIANDLNALNIHQGDSVCFVYDFGGFNIICNGKTTLLSSIENESLGTFASLQCNISDYTIDWSEETVDLGYQDTAEALSASTYISCAITSQSQMRSSGYNNLCWAASVACIGNYKKGMNTNAAAIANYSDISQSCSYAISRLNSYFSLSYKSVTGYPPSNSRIYTNIANKNPLYGVFTDWKNLSHAVVIYGVSATGGFITIMDPYTPSTHTAYSTSISSVTTYSYTSPYASSSTLYLWDYGYVNS